MLKNSCDPCRRNKLKCDGLVPCGRCSGAQRSCGYAGGETTAKMTHGARRPDGASEAQQDLTERLRIFESIFAKLHPDVPSDDMDALRKYDSSQPSPKPTAPSASSTPRYNNDDNENGEKGGDDGDAIYPRQHEVLGTTPMPTASVTVVNQGKTRKSKAYKGTRTRHEASQDAYRILVVACPRFRGQIFFLDIFQICPTGGDTQRCSLWQRRRPSG